MAKSSDRNLVYVPLLNWMLMIGTVLVAAIYNNVIIDYMC
jgi:hypothetical protein